MPLETKKYMYDVQRAANLLKDFTAGKTFDDYIQDAMLRAAVEREFLLGSLRESRTEKTSPNTPSMHISAY